MDDFQFIFELRKFTILLIDYFLGCFFYEFIQLCPRILFNFFKLDCFLILHQVFLFILIRDLFNFFEKRIPAYWGFFCDILRCLRCEKLFYPWPATWTSKFDFRVTGSCWQILQFSCIIQLITIEKQIKISFRVTLTMIFYLSYMLLFEFITKLPDGWITRKN